MIAEEFRQGMRRLLSGVSLITTNENGAYQGFIATAVCSVSAEPARLLVCVNKTVSCHDTLLRSGRLCVNVLGEQHQDMSQTFSSSKLRGERFATGSWTELRSGAPALDGALVNFDCTVWQTVPAETHTIVICDVQHIRVADGTSNPLGYLNGRYAQLANA